MGNDAYLDALNIALRIANIYIKTLSEIQGNKVLNSSFVVVNYSVLDDMIKDMEEVKVGIEKGIAECQESS